jgi:transcriptional regulator with XRE-family HTH domain
MAQTINHTPAQKIGRHIKQLRNERGIIGVDLASKVGMSQSRISKIESGFTSAKREELDRILNILDAPNNIRQQIDHFLAQNGSDGPSLGTYKFSNYPTSMLQLEQKAKDICIFVWAGIPVHFQTVVYRTKLLGLIGLGQAQVTEQIQELMLRQDLLWGKAIKFHFLIHETGLYTRLNTIPEHLMQLDRLERIILSGQVELGIIALETGIVTPNTNNYIIHDNRLIIEELADGEVESHDHDAILQRQVMFSELTLKASYNSDALALVRKAMNYFAS